MVNNPLLNRTREKLQRKIEYHQQQGLRCLVYALTDRVIMMRTNLFPIVAFISVYFGHAFDVYEVHPSFVAEVHGADLAHLSNQDFNLLNQFLLSYKVLIFKNQSALSVNVSPCHDKPSLYHYI